MRFPLLPFFTDRIHYIMSVHHVKRYTQDGDAMDGISFLFVGVDTLQEKQTFLV